jgi:hypothetical protein
MRRKPLPKILGACFVLLVTLTGLEAAIHHRIGKSLAEYVLYQPRLTL